MPYQAQTKQLDIKEAITITTLPRQTSRKKTRNQKQDISIKVRVTYQKNQTCLDIRKATHYTTFHLIQKKEPQMKHQMNKIRQQKREILYKIQCQTKRKQIYSRTEKLKKILNCNKNFKSEPRNIKYDTATNNENAVRYQSDRDERQYINKISHLTKRKYLRIYLSTTFKIPPRNQKH